MGELRMIDLIQVSAYHMAMSTRMASSNVSSAELGNRIRTLTQDERHERATAAAHTGRRNGRATVPAG